MAYQFHSPVIIETGQIQNGPLTDFVRKIHLIDDRFKHVGSGGKVQNINGYDIGARSADLATEYPFTLINYVAATGEVEIDVLEPAADDDSEIQLTYGDPDIDTNQSSTDTYPAKYKGVYPFGTSGALNLTDKTVNARTLTNNNSVVPIAGQNMGGADFDGGTMYLSAASGALTGFPCALVATFEGTPNDDVNYGVMAVVGSGGSRIAVTSFVSSGQMHAIMSVKSDLAERFEIIRWSASVETGLHRMVAIFHDADTWELYVDGELGTQVFVSGDPETPDTLDATEVGRQGTGTDEFLGTLDDVQFIDDALTADDVFADLNMMMTNDTFQSLGAEVEVPVGGSGFNYVLYRRRRR